VQIQVRLDAVTESDTPDSTVTESSSAVTESDSHCNRKSHEERKKREGKREKDDASASVSPGDSDLDGIEWHDGSGGIPDNGGVEKFKQTGDMVVDIVEGSRLKQRRGMPDWAIADASGAHPYLPAVKTFCEMTGQDMDGLRESEGLSWLKEFARLGRDKGAGAGELVEAHRILPQEGWGQWYLTNHKWSSPFVTSYAEMVVLAVRQIRDGTLERANAWSGTL